MKLRTLTMALLFSMVSLNLQAQDEKDKKIMFGVQVGLNLNMTTLHTTGASGGMKAGFRAGATADFNLAKHLWLNTALLYTSKGHKYDYSENKNQNSSENASFLQIPVEASYRLPLGSSELVVNAGPYLGFGLAGTIKFSERDENQKYFDVDNHSRFDYGLMGSVGVLIQKHVEIDAGYEYGFGDFSTKNIFITLGYKL